VNPTLAGRNGATAAPRAASRGAQAPSEPSRAQLAPPRARIVARGRTRRGPSGVSKVRSPAAFQPVQVERRFSATPCPSSRAIQARSSGEAFSALGKTRPLLPTKVACPSPSAQFTRSAGVKASSIGRSRALAAP
jgi:hypothetical protein